MSSRQLNGIIARARTDAYKIVYREVRKVLPPGWKLWLAVGWGLTLSDANGKTVFGTYENAPDRLPKGVRKACLLAADFVDTFGYGNEIIEGRKGRK